MESQPQNPEFSINPENFHPCADTFANKLGPAQAGQKQGQLWIQNCLTP